MTRQIGGSSLALVVCAVWCLAQDQPPKKPDREAIVGAWKIKSAEEGGKAVPLPELIKSMTYEFAAGEATMKSDGKVINKGKLQLDPTKDPKHFDWELSESAQVGIYKLDGDKLTLCYEEYVGTKPARPKAFKTEKGSRVILMELERLKK